MLLSLWRCTICRTCSTPLPATFCTTRLIFISFSTTVTLFRGLSLCNQSTMGPPERCPVCWLLRVPLNGPPLGIEAPPFEYDLDHDQADFGPHERCGLRRLVRDLRQSWLESNKTELSIINSSVYGRSCNAPRRGYTISTSPGNIDCRLDTAAKRE